MKIVRYQVIQFHYQYIVIIFTYPRFPFSGKRPRDLLNPKAVKYMQTVFSIKDALSKKESREISALFGVKVAQV